MSRPRSRPARMNPRASAFTAGTIAETTTGTAPTTPPPIILTAEVAEALAAKPVPVAAPLGAVDPWQHRTMGMRCHTCMFFAPKAGPAESVPLGRCRRHAPRLEGFPAVYADDWCGDHKLRESIR